VIPCGTPGDRTRLEEMLAAEGGRIAERTRLTHAYLTEGFDWPALGLAVVPHHHLFGQAPRPPGREPPRPRRRREECLDLDEGDTVVHAHHGIARYLGTREVVREGIRREFILLEFREGERLYVPVDAAELVQRYVGVGGETPSLHRLGGRRWTRQKGEVKKAVCALAADMLRVQAAREASAGIRHPADTPWQREFEAAFPFADTPDQAAATEVIKSEMARPAPMDRLICGDVGYGKTEVAIRAAFKAVEGGAQVAVLVPTTILAEQHGRTFAGRFADYPFLVEVLSRFKTPGEQADILRRTASGGVDVLIGTHRLVQPDVRFKNLGLLIIDEEQRFGVKHKEYLKRMRTQVDVLTMTATPIPRTLHMALLGIRDISNLTTPPPGRMAVRTEIVRFDRDRIRDAVRRELARDGQVYFVHNRVRTIETMAHLLRDLVPEARVEIVHGQMRKKAVRAVMDDYVRGEVDVLVTTTIIESGMDIPNANTLFIDRPHELGLADLHQLRGRVGRFDQRAFTYLILPRKKPLTETQEKRVRAVEEYSELGAGFRIALRDLEIRGAGNILGAEQSGHIAAVGYDMYCRLLQEAVATLSGGRPKAVPETVSVDLPLRATLPAAYVPALSQRMDLYRRISKAPDPASLDALRRELRDRFGPPPEEAEQLFQLARLKQRAAPASVGSIVWGDGDVYLGFASEDDAARFASGNGFETREVRPGTLRVSPPADRRDGKALLAFLLEGFEKGRAPTP